MAYQLDFTAANWSGRSRRKLLLRLLLLAAAAAFAWGVYDAYVTYNQPTLNMRLGAYEAVARPIEEMSAAWDRAASEYGALVRYYRLVWATNPTNCLAAKAASGGVAPGRGFQPLVWTLKTGGACQLDYRYVFGPGDKAAQANRLEAELRQSVTSAVAVADGKIEVAGVQRENLLNVNELALTVRFALPDARFFPAKEGTLSNCTQEVVAFRRRVQETKLPGAEDVATAPKTPRDAMMKYLPMGKDKPGFPDWKSVIDVAGWFKAADAFIAKNNIPIQKADRQKLVALWDRIGEARLPWQRFRLLDNAEIVARTKVLGEVADGVKPFKVFLDQRHADCVKKLESLIGAYDHDDVFNRPLIASDLKDRCAAGVGIRRAGVAAPEEDKSAPAVLPKADETFSFTWVRWSLSLGETLGRDGEREPANGEADDADAITLAKLNDCVRRVLTLGPGYALDTIKITFASDGNVAGALLTGLLPVKKVESAQKVEKK